jgi:hypothetical protein
MNRPVLGELYLFYLQMLSTALRRPFNSDALLYCILGDLPLHPRPLEPPHNRLALRRLDKAQAGGRHRMAHRRLRVNPPRLTGDLGRGFQQDAIWLP